ncbi:GDSL lipase/esterase [Chytriomyces sp. MP71]|nr:GDSL lipase/esterase [Chytriomyces sp. MP71]
MLITVGSSLLLATTAIKAAPVVDHSSYGKKPAAYVVVGDSLSDNGNTWKLSKFKWPEVATPSSSKDYFKGRFSDGPVWVEYLAKDQDISKTNLHDFAYAGATSNNTLITGYSGNFSVPNNAAVFSVPSALDQITKDVKPLIKHINLATSTFFIWIGANDYLFNYFDSGKLTPAQVSGQVIRRVEELLALGAQKILVFNLPPIDAIPAFKTDKTGQIYMKTAVAAHNSALTEQDKKVWSKLQKAKVSLFDVHSLVSKYATHPAKYGLKNVVDNCADDDTGMVGKRACKSPETYLWWDLYHPTTFVQQKMAIRIAKALP